MINKCLIFTSKTCRECYMLSKQYTLLESQFEHIQFEYVDVNLHPKFASEHRVMSLPALELYENEQLIAEFKHGTNKQYTHIVNFIRFQLALREELK